MSALFQGRRLRPWLLATALALATPLSAHGEPLNLADALSRAAKADPARPALASRLSAAEAGVRQAAVRPNPVIGVEVEDLAGTGSYSLVDRAQATVYYQQSHERGGPRGTGEAAQLLGDRPEHAAEPELRLVSFTVDAQEYGVPIEDVQEIVQMPEQITVMPPISSEMRAPYSNRAR